MTKRKTSFELFTGLWNAAQNHITPELHRQMVSWLSRQARAQEKRLLLMAFRGSGKSTLAGLFCAWLLSHNPDLRILVVAADEELAEHMVRHVRSVLESHPLTKNLLPKKREQWAADRLTVKRHLVSRDPSLRAAGLYSNITGARADIIICDDVEVPKTCDTAWKREQLRSKLAELDFILTPDGMMLYIGTPHTEDSLYKADGFLKNYQRLELPLTTTSWPERFTSAIIAKMKNAVSPSVFASQMELRPVNAAPAHLDPGKIQFYDTTIFFTAQRCYWDPAFGHAQGDSSVIALVGFADKNAYLHDLLYIVTKSDNQAAEQCEIVFCFLKHHGVRQLHIEGNGLGQFLPGLLRQTLRDADYACALHVVHNSKAKAQRITEAFEARLAGQAFFAHERIRQTPFIEEMRDWKPQQQKSRDDGLDAVAGALLRDPVTSRHFTRQFFLNENES